MALGLPPSGASGVYTVTSTSPTFADAHVSDGRVLKLEAENATLRSRTDSLEHRINMLNMLLVDMTDDLEKAKNAIESLVDSVAGAKMEPLTDEGFEESLKPEH